MAAAKITSKGQITVPKEVRDALGLRAGDRVTFIVQGDGTVVMAPQKLDIRDLFGSVKTRVSGVTLEDMERAIEEGATE